MRIENNIPSKITSTFEFRSLNLILKNFQALCPFNNLLCLHKCSQIDSKKLFEECIKDCESEKAFNIWNRLRV